MPSPAQIEVKRHYSELSEKETDAVVNAVASLIVGYLKTDRRSGLRTPAEASAARSHPQVREEETQE